MPVNPLNVDQGFLPSDVVRVEVERDPVGAELLDRLPNSTGALGAWGWITPVGTTRLTVSAGVFRLSIPYAPDQIPYFTSGFFAAPASGFLTVAWDVVASTVPYHQVYVDWYKADQAALSTTTLTAMLATTVTARSAAAAVPANAAFAKVRWVLSGSTGGSLPATNTYFQFKTPRAVGAATSLVGSLGTPPSAYWTYLSQEVQSINTTRAELNPGTATIVFPVAALDPSVNPLLRPGRRIRISVTPRLGAPTEWRPIFTGAITHVGATYDFAQPASTDHTLTTVTAVDACARLATIKEDNGPSALEDLPYALEKANVPWNCAGLTDQATPFPVANVATDYDATIADQIIRCRDGILAMAWLDVYGTLQAWPPYTKGHLGTDTFALNIDGWAPNAYEPGFAPPVGYNWNAGRLEVTWPVTGTWSSLVRSYTTRPGTRYRTTAVVLVSTDSPMPRLEALGVASGAKATIRDSWTTLTLDWTATSTTTFVGFVVDEPAGITAPWWPGIYVDSVETMVVLDERVYNADAAIDYDTDHVINSVAVRVKITPDTEPEYGPYINAASVAVLGALSATYTVNALTATQAAALAASVLAANATPVRQINSVVIPVNTSNLPYTTLDLYDLVRVRNTLANLDGDKRITGISHAITADSWLITLTFADSGRVAVPTI